MTGLVRFRGGFGLADLLNRADLIKELAEVRRRGIMRVESPNPRLQARGLPLLRHVGSAYGEPGQSFTRQIEQLIRASIARLPEGLARQTAETIFGLHDDLFAPKPDAWRQQAAARYDMMSLEVFRKGPELEVLGLMAAEIDVLVAGTSRDRPASVNPRYVPRQPLHEAFEQLVASGAQLIALVGLPGMGKTWLARHIVQYEDDREVPRVRSFRGNLLTRDVSAVLAQFPEVAKHIVANTPEDYLAALLSSPEGPPLLILDNLESADELAGLLPANLNAVVLATCRHRGVNPPDSCKFIEVGPMLPHEAMAMIMRRISALSEDTVVRLATTLGGYPLAIDYACSLLEHSDISPHALCDYLAINAKDTATSLLTEEGGTLWAVLRRTVDIIREDPLAYSLLECITCHGSWPVVSRHLLRRYFRKYCAELLEKAGKPDTAMRSADGLYARSVKKLYDFSLITYDPEDSRRVQLNSFVNHILARLVNPRVGEVARRVIQIIGDATEDIHEQFKGLDLTGDVGNQLQELIDQGWDLNRVIENSEILYGGYGILEFVTAINAHWPGFGEQYPDVVEFTQRFVGTMLPTLALSKQMLGFSVPGLSLNEERLAWIGERVPRSTDEYMQRITNLMNEVLRLRMEK